MFYCRLRGTCGISVGTLSPSLLKSLSHSLISRLISVDRTQNFHQNKTNPPIGKHLRHSEKQIASFNKALQFPKRDTTGQHPQAAVGDNV